MSNGYARQTYYKGGLILTGKLKPGFLWGNSVSSMQTEGAWNEGGKGLSVYDVIKATDHTSDWKVATDTYHRYKVDIGLMKEMGFNCYRFSISWSRVFPSGDGKINEEGVRFYERMIDELLENGIEPMICLYHFDMPLNLAEKYNGFASRYVVDAFAAYGKAMIDRFKDKVTYWITFNEQNIFGSRVSIGGCTLPETEMLLYQINHHVFMAHAKVTNYLHEVAPNCQIGGMIAYRLNYPATTKPEDVLATKQVDDAHNQFYLDVFTNGKYPSFILTYFNNHNCMPEILETDDEELLRAKSDFLAFSYYASSMISAETLTEDTPLYQYDIAGKVDNPHLDATEWGWKIDPTGFRLILRDMYNRYQLPVFPIENGIGVKETLNVEGTVDDDYRIKYHRDHIIEMKKAILDDGVDCMGYLGWGLIDILSSQGEMKKRYGMVYVNRGEHDLRDLKRIPKKSFYWMKRVTESNGEVLD